MMKRGVALVVIVIALIDDFTNAAEMKILFHRAHSSHLDRTRRRRDHLKKGMGD